MVNCDVIEPGRAVLTCSGCHMEGGYLGVRGGGGGHVVMYSGSWLCVCLRREKTVLHSFFLPY